MTVCVHVQSHKLVHVSGIYGHVCASSTSGSAFVLLLFSQSYLTLCVTSWTAAHLAFLSFTISKGLLKLMSIESTMPSNHLIFCHLASGIFCLIFCHPLLFLPSIFLNIIHFFCHPLLFLPSIFLNIRVFPSDSVLHIRWPKYQSFSFSISPSSEYSGLISFRTDWFYLLCVQGTLKRLLQHHSCKASILWCSAFSMVQFSHPYMATGKTIALIIWTFVGKVMSLLFNMLSIAFVYFIV